MTKNPSNEHFTAVVMPHLDDAYALARWLSGNSADAEDIVQEASLRALRGLDRCRRQRSRLASRDHPEQFTWLARNNFFEWVHKLDSERIAVHTTPLPGANGWNVKPHALCNC
jgi:DNA-directed RNA polymerase specialized sigma24 family protein